jgi:hypothetical protein
LAQAQLHHSEMGMKPVFLISPAEAEGLDELWGEAALLSAFAWGRAVIAIMSWRVALATGIADAAQRLSSLGDGADEQRLADAWESIAVSTGLDHEKVERAVETIDEIERLGELLDDGLDAETLRTTGRNAPCPCGSGKKFKRCHGSG